MKEQKGVVKWFNAERGYGFVGSDGVDYFIHYKEINSPGFKTLKEGQHVRFMPFLSPKGQVAKDLHIENGDEPWF